MFGKKPAVQAVTCPACDGTGGRYHPVTKMYLGECVGCDGTGMTDRLEGEGDE